MCGRSLVLVGAAACLVGAGCDSHGTRPKHVTILRESCNESWVPTADTFKGFAGWRQTSIRIGPITLMGAKVAARRDVAKYGSVKFRTLVRPRTRVTVEIGPEARSSVGF